MNALNRSWLCASPRTVRLCSRSTMQCRCDSGHQGLLSRWLQGLSQQETLNEEHRGKAGNCLMLMLGLKSLTLQKHSHPSAYSAAAWRSWALQFHSRSSNFLELVKKKMLTKNYFLLILIFFKRPFWLFFINIFVLHPIFITTRLVMV